MTYPDVIWISVVTGSYNFTLKLKLNRGLISPRFFSKHYKPNNGEVVDKSPSNCFYQGTADTFPAYVAVMSVCRGLRGSFGKRFEGKQMHIEPLNGGNSTLNQPHALYLRTKERGPAKCGTPHIHAVTSDTPHNKTMGRAKRRQPIGNYVVELLVVNDQAQVQRFDGNVQATVMRTMEIVNGMNSYFAKLGVSVVLSEVITWTSGNGIIAATDPAVLLDNFSGYKPNTSVQYNAALLFTGTAMDSQTIGIAYVGTMCTSTLAVGIVHDYSSALSVSSTASHELGHILSMVHDTGNCQCNDTNGCIMTPNIGGQPPTQWSSCSVSSLQYGLSKFSSCLYKQRTQAEESTTNSTTQNGPAYSSSIPLLTEPSRPEPTTSSRPSEVATTTVQSTLAIAGVLKPLIMPEIPSSQPNSTTTIRLSTTPSPTIITTSSNMPVAATCGNGIREDKEACDCGPTKACKDPCCDPATCQLVKGVQCSGGACCIACYFAHSSVTCRASEGECDMAEYCTGSSASCPPNAFFRDGTSCAKGTAYCYNGSCPTRVAQCKALYGPSGGDGDVACYKQYNRQGTVLGNCGQSQPGVFKPCSESDVLCGSLQCSTTGLTSPAVNKALGVTYMGTFHPPCKSFVYQLYNGEKNNVWTVKDGTKCGSNKVCISGQCTEIQSYPCPIGGNGLQCSGNGVCLRGTCTCNAGYSGTTCS